MGLCLETPTSVSYHMIIYIMLKSDNTNSKHQQRVTELDGHGSEAALTELKTK